MKNHAASDAIALAIKVAKKNAADPNRTSAQCQNWAYIAGDLQRAWEAADVQEKAEAGSQLALAGRS